jgi:hypothetical protein
VPSHDKENGMKTRRMLSLGALVLAIAAGLTACGGGGDGGRFFPIATTPPASTNPPATTPHPPHGPSRSHRPTPNHPPQPTTPPNPADPHHPATKRPDKRPASRNLLRPLIAHPWAG